MARDELIIREDDSDVDDREREEDSGEEQENYESPAASQNDSKKQKTVTFKVQKKIRARPQKTRKDETTTRRMKLARVTAGLVKPDAATNKEKERMLRRLATKGVVQLFNAVAERQCTMSNEVSKKLKKEPKAEVKAEAANTEPSTRAAEINLDDSIQTIE
ncbi:hypothetical protein WR25_17652 [Diploscapter pachys]|uniref:Uncharacterized protein n=1 Tax=Diploscapter pachys TaxID=2018661 RepID=A0A2A2KWM7_9BILA|nr:hypothetical protein WR25_17652 [Diploscapter pachys]